MAISGISILSKVSFQSPMLLPLCLTRWKVALPQSVVLSEFGFRTSLSKRLFRTTATMANVAKESAENNPGLTETIDEATKGYIMQQTMYRIKDPKPSLEFYSKVLAIKTLTSLLGEGLRLLKRFDYPEGKFSLYFMGYENPESIPTDEKEKVKWTFTRQGTLELTHNWGTESDPEFKGYHNGNSDPRGWGHIGITVDDVYKACERFESLGVQFVKKPDEGRMKGLAFIKDPDGYWIEILDVKHMANIV